MADHDDVEPRDEVAETRTEIGESPKAEADLFDTPVIGAPAVAPVEAAATERVEATAPEVAPTEPQPLETTAETAATAPAIKLAPAETPVASAADVVVAKAEMPFEDEASGAVIADEWPAPVARSARTAAIAAGTTPNWMRWLTGRAAAIAVAAAIGAAIGSALPAGLSHVVAAASTNPDAPDPTDALRQSISQLAAEITALKTAVGETGQAAAGGLASLEERIDGAEQTQGELAARIASLADGLAKKPAAPAAPAKAGPVSPETTGSIAPAKPPVAEGWVLWRVENGRALVQGNGGYFEVAPGSTLPGLGMVQRIMRQDGRWVVLTRNGVIVSRG
jgi:hypothetical protein